MKILHTADWHIGKLLQKHALVEEHNLFFNWLLDYLEAEQIDVLLVSGDIFDFANPSNADRSLYYSVLRRLVKLDIKVVITGGNHDSVSMLDAPKPILEAMNITIVGGAMDKSEDEIVEITDEHGNVQFLVLAVPYLRDKDIRKSLGTITYKEKVEEVRKGIQAHYDQLVKYIQEKYDTDLPIIAMGHLYLQGASTSESERDIQIGNLAGLDVKAIHANIDYMALGHIHRPQSLNTSGTRRYSGSPISLSFSERKDKKQVVVIDIKDREIDIKPVELPKFRTLLKCKGSLAEVKAQLKDYVCQDPLKTFVEIEVLEADYDPTLIRDKQLFLEGLDTEQFVVLKDRISFTNLADDITQLYVEGTQVEDLRPMEVFEKRLDAIELDDDKKQLLVEAFNEILQDIDRDK